MTIDHVDRPVPASVAEALASLPEPHHPGFASPGSWADEVIYFLLPDRFSDEVTNRPALVDPVAARPNGWSWKGWATSGATRFQGGTLKGIIARLDYLKELGVTTIWLAPVWKNRAEKDDYHLYAIQNFLDVDPRLGTRQDLVDLVAAAHGKGLRVVFDIVLNHSGSNFCYAGGLDKPPYRDFPWYDFGAWIDGTGQPMGRNVPPIGPDDGVWPIELQEPDAYHRAGFGSYGGDVGCSAWSQPRRADWFNRDFALSDGPLGDQVLEALIGCWVYWLRLTDCDGFRIDTFKHFRVDEGRRFCGAIQEAAGEMGKDNFLLLAEVGGGDTLEEEYLGMLGRNLSAVLEIGEARQTLRAVASGAAAPNDWFRLFGRTPIDPPSTTSECPGVSMGTHRDLAGAFVYTLDDHDDVGLTPVRFAADHAAQLVPAVALLLFTIGIPCLYYGTEQGFAGPEPAVRGQLEGWGRSGPDQSGDRYLREAMFGPEHPRSAGRDGRPGLPDPFDATLPGFGPFGTAGFHCFRPDNEIYQQIQELLGVRRQQSALRRGRQYLRDMDTGAGFTLPAAGGLVAWSRILAGQEVLCVVNLDGQNALSADITVDAVLNPAAGTMTVVASTGAPAAGSLVGGKVGVVDTGTGRHYVHIAALGPGAVLVLSN